MAVKNLTGVLLPCFLYGNTGLSIDQTLMQNIL